MLKNYSSIQYTDTLESFNNFFPFSLTEKGDIREFEKFGKTGRVCNAIAKDATGEIKLSLWIFLIIIIVLKF